MNLNSYAVFIKIILIMASLRSYIFNCYLSTVVQEFFFFNFQELSYYDSFCFVFYFKSSINPHILTVVYKVLSSHYFSVFEWW